jgi:hypothetical protein
LTPKIFFISTTVSSPRQSRVASGQKKTVKRDSVGGALKKMVDRDCPDRLKVQPVRKIMYRHHSVGRFFAGFSFFGFFREVCP